MKQNLHPDASYIMQDKIGVVIAKGLSVTYKEQPKNPVDFFAKWLLDQSEIQKRNQQEIANEQSVQKMVKKNEYELKVQEEKRLEKIKEKKKLDDKITAFKKKIEASEDLNDNLQDLVDHLKEFTGATSVYVGRISKPIKGVSQGLAEDEDEDAHIINGAKPEIQFKFASKGAEFMVDEVLKQEQGLTYNLFKDVKKAEEEPDFVVPEDKENGIPKHLIIKEVVKEPKIHFYRVPRLGSYMAVKLEYDSCLFESAFDAAVDNYSDVKEKNKAIEKQKQEDEEADAEEKREKEEAGEEWHPEERNYPHYEVSAFKTQKEQLCIGLNTMGKDRQFTDDEIKFVLDTVTHFKNTWEEVESKNLEKDVQWKINANEYDDLYIAHFKVKDEAEVEKFIEEAITNAQNAKTAEGEEDLTESEKVQITKESKFNCSKKAFYAPEEASEFRAKQEQSMLSQPNSEAPGGVGSAMSSIDKGSKDGDKADEGPPYTPLVPEQWQEQIRAMQNLHVVKFRRIFQSLFYFLKYRERADISLVDTNRLEWKKCRKLLAKNSIEEEDLFASLGNYWPFAPKDDEYKEYQKLAFIFDNISVINEEQVDDYSIALGQLFRWLRQAVDLRIENVKSRRARQRKLTEERQDATDKEAERCERREEELEKAKEAFAEAVREQKEQKAKEKGSDEEEEEAEEDPEFEEENFLLKFDDENPPIEIPPEVVEDVDNDFNLEDEGEEPGEE